MRRRRQDGHRTALVKGKDCVPCATQRVVAWHRPILTAATATREATGLFTNSQTTTTTTTTTTSASAQEEWQAKKNKRSKSPALLYRARGCLGVPPSCSPRQSPIAAGAPNRHVVPTTTGHRQDHRLRQNMSNKYLLQLLNSVAREARVVGSHPPKNTGDAALRTNNNSMLVLKSYDPSLQPRDAGVAEDNSIALIPWRHCKYLYFMDKYAIHSEDRNKLLNIYNNSNIYDNKTSHSSATATNNYTLADSKPFSQNYDRFYNNILYYYNYNQNMHNRFKEPHHDISLLDKYNTLQNILSKSVLVWNFPYHDDAIAANTTPTTNNNTNIKDTFWMYNIRNFFNLYNKDNNNTTLTFVSFYNKFDRDKFKLNLHGYNIDNDNNTKLLIENLS